MLKSGRAGGNWFGLRRYAWTRRYFVLESGDQVRSGILRYWLSDPNLDRQAEERFDKSVVLWDAKYTQAKPGAYYDKNDCQCFKLKHFYRTYRFCIQASDVQGGDNVAERDDWMNKVQREIRFPS